MILIDRKPLDLSNPGTELEKRLAKQVKDVVKDYKLDSGGMVNFVYPDGYEFRNKMEPQKIHKPAGLKIDFKSIFVDREGFSHEIIVCKSYKPSATGQIVANPAYHNFNGRWTLGKEDAELIVYLLHYYPRLGDVKTSVPINFIKIVNKDADDERLASKKISENEFKAMLWGPDRIDDSQLIVLAKAIGMNIDNITASGIRIEAEKVLASKIDPVSLIKQVIGETDDVVAEVARKAIEKNLVFVVDGIIKMKTGSRPSVLGDVKDDNVELSLFLILKDNPQKLTLIKSQVLK